MSQVQKISIDGVDYVRLDTVNPPITGNRCVVVVDRGWIFAGDVSTEDGFLRLGRALHVFKWGSGGFSMVVENPTKAVADLRPISDVIIPEGSVVFRVPVSDTWGL